MTRPALGEADLAARDWFRTKLTAAGLEVRTDPAANLIGRLPAADPERARTVLVGSHLDAVPHGGKLDGALGVVAALECARVLVEEGVDLPWNLEVVDFTDEEGHHFAGTVGSRAMMGLVKPDELNRRKTADVPTLAEDFHKLGLDPEGLLNAGRAPESFRAYLELHIEQGPRMEAQGLDIAAVTGIVGIYRYVVEVLGEANHAGTTPMATRRDALVAATEVLRLIPEWTRAVSDNAVATVGQIAVEPGAVNVIPGVCRFSVELRSLVSSEMVRVRDRLRGWLAENVDHTMDAVLEKDGVQLDEGMIELIMAAGEAEGYRTARLPSGAGHDGQSFAPYVPTGMIFIPSRGGLSHCPQEYSKPEWILAGAQTLLQTLLRLSAAE